MSRPRLEFDVRLLAAAAAALVAGLAVLALTRPPATVEIVTAAAALPPGVVLEGLALETARVADPAGALLAADLGGLSDRVLAAALAPGDPILESLLVPAHGDRRRVIGLLLRPEQALHGHLVAGDTVAVYAVREELPPLRLAPSVPVLSAVAGSGLGSADVALLLSVDDRLATDLIRWDAHSSLYLVRVGR